MNHVIRATDGTTVKNKIYKICPICNKNEIHPPRTRYCSDKCFRVYYHKPPKRTVKKEKERTIFCQICNEEIPHAASTRKFCSVPCRKEGQRRLEKKKSQDKKKEKEKEKIPISIDKILVKYGFDELYLFNEKQFSDWFKINYRLFGLRNIIKIGTIFPDVTAQTFSGERLTIELEYDAHNFIDHNHDVCDLIISFVKSETATEIKGIPILSVFNVKRNHREYNSFKYVSMTLSEYMRNALVAIEHVRQDFAGV